MFMLRYAKKVFSLILTTAFFLNFNVVSYATNKPELNKDDNGLIIEMAQNIAPQNEENNIEKSVHGNNVKPINVEEINNQNFEQLADENYIFARKSDVAISVNIPSRIDITPGEFRIDIDIENLLEETINGLNVDLSFNGSDLISLVAPVPEHQNFSLEFKKSLSFNVKVGKVKEEQYNYVNVNITKNTENGKKQINAYSKQVLLNKTPKQKAIIVVPGVCGSELFSAKYQEIDQRKYSKGYRFWPPEAIIPFIDKDEDLDADKIKSLNIDNILKDVKLIYCNDNGESKADIMPSNPIVDCRNNTVNRNFGIIETYKKLVNKIVSSTDPKEYNVVFFSYDWRMDNRKTARELEQFINEHEYDEVIFVAHSMGGLVCSSYLNNPVNRRLVSKIITIGTPFLGSPKAFDSLDEGNFFGGILGFLASEIVKNITRNSHATYQLLPPSQYFNLLKTGYLSQQKECCMCSKNTLEMNLYGDTCKFLQSRNWTPNVNMFLENAQGFHDSLYSENGEFVLNSDDINLYSIVGYDVETLGKMIVTKNEWELDVFDQKIHTSGDGTVPLQSSILANKLKSKNIYYVKGISHIQLVNKDDCLELVSNILHNEYEMFNVNIIRKSPPVNNTVKGCCK